MISLHFNKDIDIPLYITRTKIISLYFKKLELEWNNQQR